MFLGGMQNVFQQLGHVVLLSKTNSTYDNNIVVNFTF